MNQKSTIFENEPRQDPRIQNILTHNAWFFLFSPVFLNLSLESPWWIKRASSTTLREQQGRQNVKNIGGDKPTLIEIILRIPTRSGASIKWGQGGQLPPQILSE